MQISKGSIEVVGAGLGRTGTKSLQAALDLLGYKTYHFVSPNHAEQWASLAQGTGTTSDDVLEMIAEEGFTATCDQPTADLYAEQLEKYPNAKVILTVRDQPEQWVRSWKVLMNFIQVQERPFSLFYPSFIQWIPFMQQWKSMRDLMGIHMGLAPGELIRGWRNKPDNWLTEQYHKHNAKVKATIPMEKLLIFNVKEGWVPLCHFLGKEIPSVPFPHVNETAEINRATAIMKILTYTWIPMLSVCAAGAYHIYEIFRR